MKKSKKKPKNDTDDEEKKFVKSKGAKAEGKK